MTKVTLKLISPLWTGDIDSKSDLIQSTGIMGSLRWWTEAILRGMGKFACDPTADNRCPREKQHGNQKVKTYCTACLIWGATGIRRLFRVEFSGGEKLFDDGAINIKPEGRNKGWYLGSGLTGQIELQIVPLSNDFNESLFLIPLIIASKWAGIGAKTQIGYGVVEINENKEKDNLSQIDFEKFHRAVEKIEGEMPFKFNVSLRTKNNREDEKNRKELPDIREMFFAKVQFNTKNSDWWRKVDGILQALEPKNKSNKLDKDLQNRNEAILRRWTDTQSVPIALAIKKWLRFNVFQNYKQIKNWLFGTKYKVCKTCYEKVEKDHKNSAKYRCENCKKEIDKDRTFERIASKINISCAYRIGNNLWEFRIWGWIPKGSSSLGFNRESFLNNLKGAISGAGNPWKELLGDQTNGHYLSVWREFNSQRDTVKKNEGNINDYLQSLLSEKGNLK